MQLFSLYPHPPFFSLYPHPSSARFTIASSPLQLFSLYPHPPSVFSHCILILLHLFSLYSYPHHLSAALSIVSLFFFITSQCILFPFSFSLSAFPFSLYPHPLFLFSLNPHPPLFIFLSSHPLSVIFPLSLSWSPVSSIPTRLFSMRCILPFNFLIIYSEGSIVNLINGD
jgi:hypothetical protein